MNLAVFALFRRSLGVQARGWSAHLSRALLAAVLFVCVCVLYDQSDDTYARESPGWTLFFVTTITNITFIALAGMSSFSAALTEEKEDGTMGLLRMTRLSPLAIILGKSTSKLTGALLLLAVQLPFTILSVTLGGISLEQIWACAAITAAYLVYVSGLGTLASTIFQRSRSASALLFCVHALTFVLPLLIPQLLRVLGSSSFEGLIATGLTTLAVVLDTISPVPRLKEVFSLGFVGGSWCPEVAWLLGLGGLMMLLSWWSFELFNRNLTPPGPARPLLMARRLLGRRRRAWGLSPLAWKEAWFAGGGIVAFAVKSAAYAGLFGLMVFISWRTDQSFRSAAEGMTYVLFWFGIIELGAIAARLIRNEVNDNTLTTLALLPKSLPRIIAGKLSGGLISMLPVLTLLAFCAFSMRSYALKRLLDDTFEPGGLMLMSICLMFVVMSFTLSLWLPRGAFLLAIVASYLLLLGVALLLESTRILRNNDSRLMAMAVVAALVSGACVVISRWRLRQLISEG